MPPFDGNVMAWPALLWAGEVVVPMVRQKESEVNVSLLSKSISFYSTIDIVFRIKNRNSEWTTRQRSPLSLLACSSVVEQLANIQCVAGSIPALPI